MQKYKYIPSNKFLIVIGIYLLTLAVLSVMGLVNYVKEENNNIHYCRDAGAVYAREESIHKDVCVKLELGKIVIVKIFE